MYPLQWQLGHKFRPGGNVGLAGYSGGAGRVYSESLQVEWVNELMSVATHAGVTIGVNEFHILC